MSSSPKASKKRRSKSLSAYLSFWIISLGAIIFIAVITTNYFLSRFLLEDYVSELARTTTTSTVNKLETKLDIVSTSADALASVVSSTEISPQQVHKAIKAFLDANGQIFGMTVALEPGVLFEIPGDFSPYYYRKDDSTAYADLAGEDYQYQTWPWYTEPKRLKASIWSEPYLDEGGSNVTMTTYSTPIYIDSKHADNDEKKFAGIATADIELLWLDEVVKNIKVVDTGFGFIVSRNDIIIAHPDATLNMKPLVDMVGGKVNPRNWQKYIDSKTTNQSTYIYAPCRHTEGNCYIAIRSLGYTGWKVFIVIPELELIGDINELTIKISSIAVFGLLFLLTVVILITRHLTKPLGELASATKNIGAGDLDATLPVAVREDEIGILTSDFSLMRDSLKNYIEEVQLATAREQKLESEIQIAKDIQMSMLPGAGNVFIKQDRHQLFAYLRAARAVGGDLYYFQQSGNVLNFIIGDVSDKGVPASLFMAKTVTLYTRALKDELAPGQTFTMMNDILAENNDACMFVTALCGSVNLETGEIVMANAGHMDPVIRHAETTAEHEIQGATALGLMEDVEYPDVSFTLDSDTTIIMYTDGISEAHDTNNEQYGDEQLIELVSSVDVKHVQKTGTTIIDSVDDFSQGTEQFDDITLMIIRYE
jgi:sigma-B regulation protein RsbU (phosphoserine phosphatase)